MDKEKTRLLYPFKSDEAFDFFYEGTIAAFSGQTQRSVEMFRKSLELEPTSPYPYNFLVMSLEFTSSPEEERTKLCEQWLDVANKSGNTTQMMRAKVCLDYYKLTPEERKALYHDRSKD